MVIPPLSLIPALSNRWSLKSLSVGWLPLLSLKSLLNYTHLRTARAKRQWNGEMDEGCGRFAFNAVLPPGCRSPLSTLHSRLTVAGLTFIL